MKFDDLPMARDEDDARRVHNETARYFLSTNRVAHAEMTCHLVAEDWRKLIGNPRWARGEQRRGGTTRRVMVRELLLNLTTRICSKGFA